jgi:hypothetical protein
MSSVADDLADDAVISLPRAEPSERHKAPLESKQVPESKRSATAGSAVARVENSTADAPRTRADIEQQIAEQTALKNSPNRIVRNRADAALLQLHAELANLANSGAQSSDVIVG